MTKSNDLTGFLTKSELRQVTMNRWKDAVILVLVAAFALACETGRLAHKKDETIIGDLHAEMMKQATLNHDHAAHNAEAVAKMKAAMNSLQACDSNQ